jgi:Protein of unknown function (DUF2439)
MNKPSATMATASSPTSAPIHDFDCIYSYDIQRKRQKRWHDGFLRFHAFNRRVMVYDVPRNFIGDTHLKADDLQDGDEVQLDRGVLVEVGQSRGSVQQDVTPLFERKRVQAEERRAPSRQPPQCNAGPSVTPMGRSSPMGGDGLLRPKSLNLVLGSRKGLQGRAVLAKQSPFGQTNGPETRPASRVVEPPAKRQRTEQQVQTRNSDQPTDQTPKPARRPRMPPRAGDRFEQPVLVEDRGQPPSRTWHTNRSSPTPPRGPKPIQSARHLVAPPDPEPQNPDPPPEPPAAVRSRPTSRLKATSTKRSKLMCLSKPTSSPSTSQIVTGSPPSRPQAPQRRAPLRVSDLDEPSSSPPGTNLTVMAFPTSHDMLPVGETALAKRRTLAELDKELLSVSRAQEAQRQSKERVEQAEDPPPQPAPAPAPDRASAPAAPSAPMAPPAFAPAARATRTTPLTKTLTEPVRPQPKTNTATTATATSSKPDSRRTVTAPARADTAAAKPAPGTRPAPAPAPATRPPAPATRPPAANPPAPAASRPAAAAPANPPAPAPPASAEPDTGPWSRTAFDLFGYLVPAGVDGDKDKDKDEDKVEGSKKLEDMKRRCRAIRGSTRGMMREWWD